MSYGKKWITPKTDAALRFVVAPLVLVAVAALIIIGFFNVENEPAEAAVLKQGSTGDTVRELQTRLKNWGYYTGSVDGIYGSLTVAAVKYFQRVNGLAVDGIVGEKTAAAVGIWLGEGSGTGSYSSSDEYLLARLVYAEARGQSALRFIPEHDSGRHLSTLGVFGGQRRADKPYSQSDGDKRRA